MRTRGSFALSSCCLLAAACLLPGVADARGEEAAAERSVQVLCEAWRVTDTKLADEVEALLDRKPDAAEEARGLLCAAGEGAERLARLSTPATDGKPVQLDDMRHVAISAGNDPAGGATPGGFGGFMEVGAKLQLVPRFLGGGSVELELQLTVHSVTSTRYEGHLPPGKGETRVKARIPAPLGQTRLFESNVDSENVVYVFVRATSLGVSTDSGDEGTQAEAEFSAEEIARFAALKRHVEEVERKNRSTVMISRQLDRLGVELTAEQRGTVIELLRTCQTAMRERLRSRDTAGAGREERQAAFDALRQELRDGLDAVVDAETAEKVMETMGRSPGFGGRR